MAKKNFSYNGYKAKIIVDESKESDDPLVEKQCIAIIEYYLKETIDELLEEETKPKD